MTDPRIWTDAEWNQHYVWLSPSLRTEGKEHLPYACRHCSYLNRDGSDIKRHVLAVHLDWRPHACNLCDRRFGVLSKLKTHQRSHTGETPFPCPLCEGKSFRYRDGLTKHLREVHANIRSWDCYCGQSFARKQDLARHQQQHENDRPYECMNCHRRFARKEHLIAHEQSRENRACGHHQQRILQSNSSESAMMSNKRRRVGTVRQRFTSMHAQHNTSPSGVISTIAPTKPLEFNDVPIETNELEAAEKQISRVESMAKEAAARIARNKRKRPTADLVAEKFARLQHA